MGKNEAQEGVKWEQMKDFDDIVKERLDGARERYADVQYIFNNAYGWPELDIMRGEVCLDFVVGLFQSAMTLTNMLLESALQISLIYTNSDQASVTSPSVASMQTAFGESIERFSSEVLYKTIERAFTQGLISEDTKTKLHKFRELFRNSYSHADISKMFGDHKISVQMLTFNEDKSVSMQRELAKVAMLPMLYGEAVLQHAQANALPYFRFVDALIRDLKARVFPGLETESIA